MGIHLRVLIAAGFDGTGAAGLLRDLATARDHGVETHAVITAVTAQSDREMRDIHPLPARSLAQQITGIGPLTAIKLGMLKTAEIVSVLAETLPNAPLVLDPVLASSSGAALLDPEGIKAMRARLFPRTRLLTPNLPEAAQLTGRPLASSPEERAEQAAILLQTGTLAVLLKGGHDEGPEVTDWLFRRETPPRAFSGPRAPRGRRGTGCTLATAIACQLAQGKDLETAVGEAVRYTRAWIASGG
jgi:hydroxymethylpyrimidine/phosphomethylpyrimidine kinase